MDEDREEQVQSVDGGQHQNAKLDWLCSFKKHHKGNKSKKRYFVGWVRKILETFMLCDAKVLKTL